MKKQLLSLVMFLLPLVANAYDIGVQNEDGVTIYYNYINNGTELEVASTNYDCYWGVVVIPEEVTYMSRTRIVTRIGHDAFRGCSNLTGIIIPNSVTSIGYEAFSYCSKLTSITIPNSVTSIGFYMFYRCSSLTSITIPNSVTSIEAHAFQECSNLASIIIPNSVTSIGASVFEDCHHLTSITIPNSVTSIGERSFYNCYSLTGITIPNSVTSIGASAFAGCNNLTSITIPNSVTSIGESAFNSADFPTVISLIEEPFGIPGKKAGKAVFSLNTFNNATLYVPIGTIEKYKATDGWKDFLFIEEGTGGGDTPIPQKCEKPTISYSKGKLTFHSATDGAVCQSTITDADIASYSSNEVQLGVTYHISIYATKAGYENSETATATLYWIDVQPRTEGITNGVANVPAKAVMIQSDGDVLTIQGVDDGTQVGVYGIDGAKAGSAVSQNGIAHVTTSLQPGSIAIVKIGEKSVKVVVK